MNNMQALERTIELCLNGQLECDPRFLNTELSVLATICNGCGAANAKVDFVPDTCYGLYVGYACFIHDFDYNVGTTEADRRFADERFRNNLLKLIAPTGPGSAAMWAIRRVRVNTTYQAVRIGGESPFWSGKDYNVVTLR